MSPRRRFNTSISNKLILLSVIPVAIVTTVLTWYTIDTRRAEIRDNQVRTARELARNLAQISDFALYTGNQAMLRPLASSAGRIPSISSIYFLSAERRPLLSPDPEGPLTEEQLASGEYTALGDHLLVTEQPVYPAQVDVTDYQEPTVGPRDPLLGWVVVASDNRAALAKSRDIVITHLIIALAVMLGAVLVSWLLSNRVVAPILDMTRVVRKLERGNLDARIEPRTGDELALLANGINHLGEAVSEARENLEKRVSMATRQLTLTLEDLRRKNRELDLAREEAESANTAKGDFLAQMSHELRTPITAIQGFVKLLDESDLKPSQRRYCSIIQQASLQLLQLIDDILDITRLQSSAITIDDSPFDLSECVESAVSLMAPTAHDKGLELILDVTPDVPEALVGDSLRIRQIIYNLVSNAIKFTTEGFICVKVRSQDDGEDRVLLYIQVIDTGIGIPEKHQASLFEPFHQGDNSISRRFGGSGLGLSIVKQLVELMGGTLGLKSATGQGTTFTLTLPLQCQARPEVATDSAYQRVLLFDPHPQSRQALEHRLARYVEVVESCESFDELELDDAAPTPDVIVYSPPLEIDADRLTEQMRRLRSHFHCPIAMLGSASTGSQRLPREAMDDLQPLVFLDKPPLSADLARLFSPRASLPGEGGAERRAGLDAHILAAEDNEFTRLLLSSFFEDSGSQLTLVTDGCGAIEACQRERFDLILMDVHMPGIDGLDALRRIRGGTGPNRDTPVVMLTADILQQEENALFDAGATDLIFKPFDEGKLFATARRHLRNSAGETSAARPAEAAGDERKQLFAREVARLTRLARDCLDGEREEELRDAVHQLLGIAGVYRQVYLERAVRSLHQAIKQGNEERIHAAMDTLQLETDAVVEEMGG